MLIHPIHCHDICRARQKEREAEARLYRFQRSIRGRSKGAKLVADLGRAITGVVTAITRAITGLPWLPGNDDLGQPEAA